MKKPFYLVGLAALALAGCSDNDFLGGGPDANFGQASKGQLAFGIKDESGKTVRGEITGEQAAEKLNKKFTVYGWKQVNDKSGATAGFEDVFQDYVVKWEGIGSAGTTESNTRGWEYVGYQSEPVDGTTPYNQTIKYWDWSTDRYDFIAWSIANGNAQVLTRTVVPGASKPEKNEPGLTFFAPTAKDLGGVFVSDKFTSVPLSESPHVINTTSPWTDAFAGLANVNTHPYPTAHRGLYSQLGTNVTANGEEGIVNLQFRNLAAKARIGIYETIPGYKVSNVVFYRQDDAEGGSTKYQHTWNVADDNEDYNADQSFATLYAKDATPANAEIFARRGEISVKYHDTYYNAEGTEKDNVAYTAVTGTDKQSYFAFGKLTNERGTETAIGANPIGVTSNTASMSIGNDADKLYTYVFPMETNDHVLNLKVNYLLTSIDGSKEEIRVTGANAVVPVEFAKWKPNYAYTYLFKISDNTNGYTNPELGPAGLYPITFDACLVNTEDGMQQTITTVNDKSITTYQDGSEVTANNEYKLSKNIYFTIEGNEGTQSLHKPTAGTDVWLYTAWAADPSIITEEAVANYKANNIVLTDVTDKLTAVSSAPNSSGAKYDIQFGTDMAMMFSPVAKYYVVKAQYTDDGKTYLSYKVIKIEDGSETKSYTISDIVSIANNGSTTFTITNTASDSNGATGNVTGAKGAIKITSGAKDVTDLFTISETGTAVPYTYTIKSNAPAGTYNVSMGGTTKTIEVAVPKWTNATVNVEEGKTATNIIKDKDGGAIMVGITPTVTPQSGAVGKLTASVSDASGEVTLSPAAGSYGEFKVAYHGGEFTVQVDKYELSVSPAIINAGDAEHKTATITLINKNTTGTAVNGKTVTIDGTSHITETSLTTAGSGDATVNINAVSTGTTKFTYNNASCEVEVVNYEITTSTALDGVRTIKLTKDGEAVNGATFTATGTATVQATSPTATPGVYKVTGTGATTISFKYKGVVVADIDLPAL